MSKYLERIADALERIADAMEHGAKLAQVATPVVEAAKTVVRPAQPAPEPAPAGPSGLKIEDVRTAFIERFRVSPDAARASLQSLGVSNLTDIKPADYAAAIEAFKRG